VEGSSHWLVLSSRSSWHHLPATSVHRIPALRLVLIDSSYVAVYPDEQLFSIQKHPATNLSDCPCESVAPVSRQLAAQCAF
jgi:hypothetical protein